MCDLWHFRFELLLKTDRKDVQKCQIDLHVEVSYRLDA